MPPSSAIAAHQAVERIDLADEMPLPQPADRRVARHRADGRKTMGDQRRPRAHARRRSRRLTAGMAAADHDDIESGIHRMKFLVAALVGERRGCVKALPRDVSRETYDDPSPASGRAGWGPYSRSAGPPFDEARPHPTLPETGEGRPHFPIQKSRKITSSTSSTSTRPVSRPRSRAAKRSSSAKMSSRPSGSARARPSD